MAAPGLRVGCSQGIREDPPHGQIVHDTAFYNINWFSQALVCCAHEFDKTAPEWIYN